jgi:rod shape-determining protein MreC
MRRNKVTQSFVLFFILSLASILLFRSSLGGGIKGLVEQILSPLQRVAYAATVALEPEQDSFEIKKLKEEILQLRKKIVDQQNIARDNQAFHDQFANSPVSPKRLLPVAIIGMQLTTFIIDKGDQDGVHEGTAIIYKDVLLGKVIHSSAHVAVVATINNKLFSLTGRTSETNALGIVKGQDGGILFDKVVLSDKLSPNTTVETKGDINEKGVGVPPGLMIGKIVSVHKSASSLFQAAEIVPLITLNKLTIAFAMLHTQ